MRKLYFLKTFFIIFFISLLFVSCRSTKTDNSVQIDIEKKPAINTENTIEKSETNKSITLLFGGDIMAHDENYKISSFDKIWKDILPLFDDCDLSFANIESPININIPVSSYPNFNMNKEYVQAAIDAGFNVFSLCNNHTNDQGLEGIKETIKITTQLKNEYKANGKDIYFSGLREVADSNFSYNVIEKNDWKILFFPVTELLNRQTYTSYINYLKPTKAAREEFINEIQKLKEKNQCDLFILSIHTSENEYIRTVENSRELFYKDLLEAGIDIIWANHTHLIKDRKVIVDTNTNSDKLIMYANGNVISGQRRAPKLDSSWPNGERDNTGDGLLYKVTFTKDNNGRKEILKAEPIYITTYINTAKEFIIKILDNNLINYLYEIERNDWAKYLEKRIKINKEETKDLIEWQ